MTLAAEHRRPIPSDAEAILNALPNPVLLIAPDGRIVDANIAAESFFTSEKAGPRKATVTHGRVLEVQGTWT